MPTLTLEGSGVVVNLDALTRTQEGAQAVAGITGFGLPPVSVQWAEGAGDGARFRGRRVQMRPIDLPLTYYTRSRASLKAQVRDLSTVLSGEATLRLTEDDGTSRSVRVHRTGGGDFNYGTDTDGRHYLKTVVTLTAGDPFWESDAATEADYSGTGIPTSLVVVNDGTADAFPVWKITGPGLNWTATSPTGEVLAFADFIPQGATITIDTKAGTVVDQHGVNRYAALGPAPRFFTLPPGESVVQISYDRSSADFLAAAATGRTNYVPTPLFKSGAGKWDLRASWAYDPAGAIVGSAGTFSGFVDADLGNEPGSNPVRPVLTGLTPGRQYQVWATADVTYVAESATVPPAPTTQGSPVLTYAFTGRSSTPAQMIVLDYGTGHTLASVDLAFGTSGLVSATFVAQSESVFLRFSNAREVFSFAPPAGSPPWFLPTSTQKTHAIRVDNVFLGEVGQPFTGDTPKTARATYRWTGTPDASTSVETLAPDPATTHVAYSFNPRDWLVI